MTTVAISETNIYTESITPNIFSHNPPSVDRVHLHRTQALSNLIERTTKELENLNQTLEQRVEEEIAKNSKKDSLLHMMQSQVQLGEMVEMIIHQWRQPLSAITSTVSSAQIYKSIGELDDEKLDKVFSDILSFTEHLNNTISDFKEFFKTDVSTRVITLDNLFKKAEAIIDPIVKKSHITLIKEFHAQKHCSVDISLGLMLQVLLNIIKNSTDVFHDNSIDDPQIIIRTSNTNENCKIEICDNGGGIPEDILPRIFDKRFSTKGEKGTGIGLDMSRTIVESKLNGKLTARNESNWAIFTIELPIIQS